MKGSIKLEKSLVGATGVFYASAELSRRGWIAMPTIRNTRGIDIIATKNGEHVKIQVKTNSYGKIKYPMNKSNEELTADDTYYVFVTLKSEQERPDCYILPSKLVVKYIKEAHKKFAGMKPRRKIPRKENETDEERRKRRMESTMRQFPTYGESIPDEFVNFKIGDYKDNWKILESRS